MKEIIWEDNGIIVTLSVKLDRENLDEDEKLEGVKTLSFVETFDESWWMIICNKA